MAWLSQSCAIRRALLLYSQEARRGPRGAVQS
nr:MAG TPA: hypothetical protein [Caudoviricetes sp.]